MRSYRFQNNLLGWIVCAIATFVFVSTAEHSGSWWDCGEYIATSAKMMVGHPPGAPTFQILGAIASVFVGRDPALMGQAINTLSAVCSGFTILFLFWTITMIAKMVILAVYRSKDAAFAGIKASSFQPNTIQRILIFTAGLVGALAYTFTDSFWFSAVEGEVYAMSSFFTAITFWSILKWNNSADEPHSLRWLIFIAFLVGLAIGVHLLNLLVIPAIVFIIYYRKFETSKKRFWMSLLISVVILAGILWGVVPWTVKLAGYFELFFVNSLGLPFNSGTIVYLVLLVSALIFGLRYSLKKQKVLLNTALLCLCFLLIGYSTFITLMVRANADVPINQGENKDAISLLAYLNRDQYGSTPLIYGQFFNAPVRSVDQENPQYRKDDASKRYVQAGFSAQKVTYDPAFCGLFPRMWSSMESGGRPCVTYNKIWSGTDGSQRPTLGENMRFFVRYQLNWMYFRYFMWNFVGRQNDIMGRCYNSDGSRDVFNGNWISGIKVIDELRLGPQDNLPDYLAKNPARTTFFFLPLLLGLCGLLFHYKHDRRNCFVVFLLFFMTGIAIAIYLNQPSTEPRERDYAFAGSFYAFAIWIGIGAAAIIYWILSKIKSSTVIKGAIAICVSAVCLVAVPGVMAKEGWKSHDRSKRTSARDFARNMLLSCEPNAVLVSDGDNDTFPLWYCQQVEGIRTDIRVINSMLANSQWLLDPLFRTQYNSAPLKFTLPKKEYSGGKNEVVFIEEQMPSFYPVEQLLNFVASEKRETKVMSQGGEMFNYFPTRNLSLSIPKDKLSNQSFFTAAQIAAMPESLNWTLQGSSISKSNLAILDIVANNLFNRPIYFISPHGHQSYLPLEQSQIEGMVFRFVPYQNLESKAALNDRINGMNVERTYMLLVDSLKWGEISSGKTAMDPETRSWARQARQQYSFLATALAYQNEKDKAIKALDKGMEYFPDASIPFDTDMVRYLSTYLSLGQTEKAKKLGKRLLDIFESRIVYAESFPSKYSRSVSAEYNNYIQVVEYVKQLSEYFQSAELVNQSERILSARQ